MRKNEETKRKKYIENSDKKSCMRIQFILDKKIIKKNKTNLKH